MPHEHPHVEIAAIVRDGQGRLAIGKRKGKHGAGMLAVPPAPPLFLSPDSTYLRLPIC